MLLHEVLQEREQLKRIIIEKDKSKGIRGEGEKEAEVGERGGEKEAAAQGQGEEETEAGQSWRPRPISMPQKSHPSPVRFSPSMCTPQRAGFLHFYHLPQVVIGC